MSSKKKSTELKASQNKKLTPKQAEVSLTFEEEPLWQQQLRNLSTTAKKRLHDKILKAQPK